MPSPADLRYTDTHEWVRVDKDIATIGVTQFAVDELTDITYVQMKPAGTPFKAGDVVGEVESVKTTSDIYCFVDGQISEVNPALNDNPGLLNTDPFGAGWLIKVKVTDATGAGKLADAAKYDAQIAH